MIRFATFGLTAGLFLVAFASFSTGQEKTGVSPHETQTGGKSIRVVFLAGRPSHGYGAHEHYAGCRLLAHHLERAMPGIKTEVFKHEWPEGDSVFDNCDAIVMYCDGGPRHPANEHLELIDRLAERGVGIVCLHYGVEVPKGESGDKFLNWIGGYFEPDWSVNPHWIATYRTFPDHPISRGVKPFSIEDEWYFHMRFREEMEGVTPILTDIPPESTMSRPDDPHAGNPRVRKAVADKEPQHMAWAYERPGGGRGFGFTGGHDHWNWGDENFRKIVLNAIVWSAGAEIPENGVENAPVPTVEAALDELKENQDFDEPEKYDWEKAKSRISRPKQ